MSKVGLIIGREYWTRVKKKSFILMSILTPLIFAGVFALIIYIGVKQESEKIVEVVDETGLFVDKLPESNSLKFLYSTQPLQEVKDSLEKRANYGILHIPKIDIDDPKGVRFYSQGNPSFEVIAIIRSRLRSELQSIKMEKSGISPELLAHLRADVDIETINLDGKKEKQGSAASASLIGVISGFLIYFFVILYGTQIMRGVAEEKSTRIVEVIVSSVKPFELMIGKIVGIALVGLTQFGIWVLLSLVLSGGVMFFFGAQAQPAALQELAQSPEMQQVMSEDPVEKVMASLASLNLPLILGMFVFYFIGGYLLYGALFAAIGAAVDDDADTQQFMFPLMFPLIIAMSTYYFVMVNPDGPLAFWMSIIPFTSPIIMMIRIPFEVPLWELLLSMTLLVAAFLGTTWFAGKIYRIGILIHGSKISYKVIWKWLFQ